MTARKGIGERGKAERSALLARLVNPEVGLNSKFLIATVPNSSLELSVCNQRNCHFSNRNKSGISGNRPIPLGAEAAFQAKAANRT